MSATNNPNLNRPASDAEIAAMDAVIRWIDDNYNGRNLTGARVPADWADKAAGSVWLTIRHTATIPSGTCHRLRMPGPTTFRAAVAMLAAEQDFGDWVLSEFATASAMTGLAAPVASRKTVCPAAVATELGLPDNATFADAVAQVDVLLRARRDG